MKNYSVKILPEATNDLNGLLDYIAVELSAPMAAINLNVKITEIFDRLEKFPLMGTLVPVEAKLTIPQRWVRVENYMIFYAVDEQSETVYITRILFSTSNYLLEL